MSLHRVLACIAVLAAGVLGWRYAGADETLTVLGADDEETSECLFYSEFMTRGFSLKHSVRDADDEKNAVALHTGQADLLLAEPWRGTRLEVISHPFLFRDVRHFVAFSRSPLFREIAEEDAGRTRLRALALIYARQQVFEFWHRAPLVQPAHYRGATVGGSSGAAWKMVLGADVSVEIDADRLAEALRSGRLDGVSESLSVASKGVLRERARYFSATPASIAASVVYASEDAWRAWTPAKRELVARVAARMVTNCSSRNFELNKLYLDNLHASLLEAVPMDRAALFAALRPHLHFEGWQPADIDLIAEMK